MVIEQPYEQPLAVVNNYTYEPFGQMLATECTETTENSFKFTGQYYDAEIAQYYLRARQYDPQLMRFTGRDPVRGKFPRPMTLHKYLYCLNDPIDKTDLTGEAAASQYLEPIYEAAWTATTTVLSAWSKTSNVLGPITLAMGTAEAGFNALNILYIRSLQHILMNEIIVSSGLGGLGAPLSVGWDLLFGKNVLEGWIETGYEYWRLGAEWWRD